MVDLLGLQAEYREKRRKYLTLFDGVPPELYSADLVDYTSLPVSSSSSGDQDGPPSSPGVRVTVSRQDSVSSGDAFIDVASSGLATVDVEVDAWSVRSSSAGGDELDDDGRLRVAQRSVSASDPNFQMHYEWLNDVDDVSESPEIVDVPPDVEELELDVSDRGE